MIDRTRRGWAKGIAALALVASAVLAAPTTRGEEGASSDSKEILARDDFERDQPDGWDFTDRDAWRITNAPGRDGRVLELFQASKYEPSVRSPFNIALRRDAEPRAFVMDVKVRSTTRDYGHRDLCLIFGHVDPSHFYYVHIAKEADPHANSIFLVDGKPRVSIAETRTKGTAWTDGWHHVRLLREPASGLIAVYFDDMKTPIMTAHDRTFARGRIGLGSFDDTGMFDDLVVKLLPDGN